MPQPAQFLQVFVRDPRARQGFSQRVGIELRIMPRTRNRADIHQSLDSVLAQQGDEFIDRAGRMADGQDERRRRFLFLAQSNSAQGPSSQLTLPNRLKSRITSTISVSAT